MRSVDSKTKLPAGYSISPDYGSDEVTIRRAYRSHRCDGGWNNVWNEVRKCRTLIESGDTYVATKGKTYGYKHHLDCAVERGLLERDAQTNNQ